jgi:signal transduction histidine kinase
VLSTGPGAGHGITGMRERAGLYGGEFSAAPRPGGGFRVSARFPLTGTTA